MSVRLFHGSRSVFDQFDPYQIGMGAEPNSVLGVWLTRDPEAASGYGGGRAIMIVEAETLRLAPALDRHTAIWGGPDLYPTDRELAWPRFEKARKELMSLGYDGIICEMEDCDLEGAICIFDPEKLTIVEAIEYPEDRDIYDLSSDEAGLEVDASTTLDFALTGRDPVTEITLGSI